MKIHVIPVGIDERAHSIPSCWCRPFKKKNGTVVHHVKGCRKKFEKQVIEHPDMFWVNVLEED